MKREAWGLALLTVLCLVLAAVITTSTKTPIVSTPDSRSSTPTSQTAQVDQPRERPGTAPDAGQSDLFPFSLWVFVYVLLIGTLVLLALVFWGGVRRWRAQRLAAARFVPSDLDALDADLERRLVDAVEAQLADLGSGTPRNAVVACWLTLEEAVAGTGFYRDPALTSAEFTQQVLAAYALDDHAIQRLCDLYREARFSVHQMTEEHRDAAAGAVGTLKAELADRVAQRARNAAPAPAPAP